MNSHQLTQEQIEQVAKYLSDGTEIPENLLRLLNPAYFEKLFQDYNIDYQKLEKYKIPTIEYAGKRSEALILSQAGAMGGGSPLQIERAFENNKQINATSKDGWENMIVQGDNLQFLKTCYLNQDPLIKDKVKGKVKLIYIDPPFGTGDEYGGSDGALSYSAKIAGSEFIEAMRERLIFLREILHEDGSIFIRIDYHFGHQIKIILDEIFGTDNFKNEIIINRFKRQQKGLTKLNVGTDILFLYCKNKNTSFFREQTRPRLCSFCGQEKDPEWHAMISSGLRNPPERIIEGRLLLPPKGQHWKYVQEKIDEMSKNGRIRIIEKASYTDLAGNRVTGMPEFLQTDDETVDNNWTDLRGYAMNSSYPTENHEELLERVIKIASSEGDLVIDCFGGSGTTGIVAEKLNRKWILCDFGKHAIYYMQKRFLQISSSKALSFDESQVTNKNISKKYDKNAKPFCIASVGAYDFQRIMNLRDNKPAYIDFVLSLFGVTERAKIENGEYSGELERKFKISNVFAQKDGNPVEIYPIWQDEFLKHIKIDREYLEGIINQSGGKIRGKYFIIAPETCDVIGDTTIGETEFIIMSYPYKILEEMSRNFQLTEQPSSTENINDLVTSVRFYFNEDIEIGVERVEKGLKINRFVSPILDKDGNHFEGLGALAMLLVDKDYDGVTFRMEEAVYAKEIKEDGICILTELTDQVAVIAIDKHGNESKIVKA